MHTSDLLPPAVSYNLPFHSNNTITNNFVECPDSAEKIEIKKIKITINRPTIAAKETRHLGKVNGQEHCRLELVLSATVNPTTTSVKCIGQNSGNFEWNNFFYFVAVSCSYVSNTTTTTVSIIYSCTRFTPNLVH
jgi:hypothetical protein